MEVFLAGVVAGFFSYLVAKWTLLWKIAFGG